MEHAARVDAAAVEIDAFVGALAAGPLDAPVPTCPDFTVDDLAQHVGAFCGFWTHILCEGTRRPKPPFDELGTEGRVEWFRSIGSHLVAELRATPPDTAVWTWFPADQSAGFVTRRVANELAIHRVDAQAARGKPGPVGAELAVDGIDEIFVLLTHIEHGDPRPDRVHTLHLHGTDVEQSEWLITFGPDGIEVAHEHAKGDLALKASVSDLEMLLYQRPTAGDIQRFGDDAVLTEFHRVFTF